MYTCVWGHMTTCHDVSPSTLMWVPGFIAWLLSHLNGFFIFYTYLSRPLTDDTQASASILILHYSVLFVFLSVKTGVQL